MWFEGSNVESLRSTKEFVDGVEKYGWEEYNMDDYGCFRVKDVKNQVNLVFSFVRQENDIVLRVEGESLDESRNPSNITLLHYAHNPYLNNTVSIRTSISDSDGIVILHTLFNCIEIYFRFHFSHNCGSFDEFYVASSYYSREPKEPISH